MSAVKWEVRGRFGSETFDNREDAVMQFQLEEEEVEECKCSEVSILTITDGKVTSHVRSTRNGRERVI